MSMLPGDGGSHVLPCELTAASINYDVAAKWLLSSDVLRIELQTVV
jgi:hypothetical protein